MSTLYMIRHGQASFGQADYDRLEARVDVADAELAVAQKALADSVLEALLQEREEGR